jgi:hypothetical protein
MTTRSAGPARITASEKHFPHQHGLRTHRSASLQKKPASDMSYMVAHSQGIFAFGRAEESILFHEMLHNVQHFVKKKKHIPCCRRRIGTFIPANAWFETNRVTRASESRHPRANAVQ